VSLYCGSGDALHDDDSEPRVRVAGSLCFDIVVLLPGIVGNSTLVERISVGRSSIMGVAAECSLVCQNGRRDVNCT
jgi:hypothetical protein